VLVTREPERSARPSGGGACAAIATIVWEACGLPADELELNPLPSFPVDVERRWPSAEKAKRLLGWESQIDVREGVAQTVECLRERVAVET
jgi:UDP-glucose 4-epimerase